MSEGLRHAILGAGGIGGLLGAALAHAGREVTLVVRDRDHPTELRLDSRVLGDISAAVAIATTLPPGTDVLWVTVKSQQLEEALRACPPAAVGGARVVPLLNGVEHLARLRAIYGPGSVTAGTIQVESERLTPGHYRQLSPFMRVGLAGPGADVIAAELEAAGITASVEPDEATLLWRKLAVLASLALTTTALEAPIGSVRADPAWRQRLLAVASEVCAVAAAEGAGVDPRATRQFVLGVPDAMRSSMQKDRAAGRPLELDAIGGAVQRAGRRHGVPTPVVDELVAEISVA